MGVGLPYAEVKLPRSVPRIFDKLKSMGLAPEQLEFHPHNDTWMIVVNCLSALMHGCGAINGTCLGKGERSGNAPLEGVLLQMMGMGYFSDSAPDFTALNKLVDLYDKIGHAIANKYPMYGRDAHRTRAGIHADGLNKFWQMYAPFNAPKLLGRPLEVSLTKDSGLAGVQFLIKQHLGRELDKQDPALQSVNSWVAEQFGDGRQTAIEWEEIKERVVAALG
jgi:2-phosphinomethylmalic acid synthase